MASNASLIRSGGAFMELFLDHSPAIQGLRQFEAAFRRSAATLAVASPLAGIGNVGRGFSQSIVRAIDRAFNSGVLERAATRMATQLGRAIEGVFTGRTIRVIGSQLEQAGSRMFASAGRLLAVGTVGLAGGLFFPVRQFAIAEQQLGRFRSVLGDLADRGREFGDSLARDVNQSIFTVRDQLAQFQSVFRGSGFNATQSFTLSTALAELTQDLLAFDDGLANADEAAARLLSGLAGEVRPVQRFGADVRKASIEQELLALGINKTSNEAAKQERILARLSIIYRALSESGAVGQARREFNTLAAEMRGARGAIVEMAVAFGKALAPIASTFLNTIKGVSFALRDFAGRYPNIIRAVSLSTVAFTAAAGAMAAFAVTTLTVGVALRGLGGAVTLLLTPLRLLAAIGPVLAASFGAVLITANLLRTAVGSLLAVGRGAVTAGIGLSRVSAAGFQLGQAATILVTGSLRRLATVLVTGIARATSFAVVSVVNLTNAMLGLGAAVGFALSRGLLQFGQFAFGGGVRGLLAFTRQIGAVKAALGTAFAVPVAIAAKALKTFFGALSAAPVGFLAFVGQLTAPIIRFIVQATRLRGVQRIFLALGGVFRALLIPILAVSTAFAQFIGFVVPAVVGFAGLISAKLLFVAGAFISVLGPVAAVGVAIVALVKGFQALIPLAAAALESLVGAAKRTTEGIVRVFQRDIVGRLRLFWGETVAVATRAFEGLRAAIASADIGTAISILWASIRVVFFNGVRYVLDIWNVWAETITDVASRALTAVATSAANAYVVIGDGWADVMSLFAQAAVAAANLAQRVFTTLGTVMGSIAASTEGRFDALWENSIGFLLNIKGIIQDGFQLAGNIILNVFDKVLKAVEKVKTRIQDLFSEVDLEAEDERINQKFQDRQTAREKQLESDILRRQTEREQEQARRDAQKEEREERIRAAVEERVKRIQENAAGLQKATDQRLRQAIADLQKLSFDAKVRNQFSGPEGGSALDTFRENLQGILDSLSGVAEGGGPSRRAQEAVFANIAQFGLGAASIEQRQLEEQIRSRKLLEQIEQKQDQPVIGP